MAKLIVLGVIETMWNSCDLKAFIIFDTNCDKVLKSYAQSALTPRHERRWITANNKYCLLKFKSKGSRDGSRTAATSKMELLVIIVNGIQPLTIITKCSILDVAAALDPPLGRCSQRYNYHFFQCQAF